MTDEEKRLLEALETIKSVCERNECRGCPLGCLTTYNGGAENIDCKIKDATPCQWVINKNTVTWRALL